MATTEKVEDYHYVNNPYAVDPDCVHCFYNTDCVKCREIRNSNHFVTYLQYYMDMIDIQKACDEYGKNQKTKKTKRNRRDVRKKSKVLEKKINDEGKRTNDGRGKKRVERNEREETISKDNKKVVQEVDVYA